MKKAITALIELAALSLLPIGAAHANSWIRLDGDVEVWRDIGVLFEFRLVTYKRPPEIRNEFDTATVAIDCHSGNHLLIGYQKGAQVFVDYDSQWSAPPSDSRALGRRMTNWACALAYVQTEYDGQWEQIDPIGGYYRKFSRHFELRLTLVGAAGNTSNVVVVDCTDRAIRMIAFVRHGGGGKELRVARRERLDPTYPSLHGRVCQ
jgi:hypothetical protein